MPPPPRRHLTLARTLGEMRESLSNRSFLFLLASSITGAMAAGLGASLNIYFNTFFWEFSSQQISLPDAGRVPLGGDRADRRADALAPVRQAHRHPADAGAVGDRRPDAAVAAGRRPDAAQPQPAAARRSSSAPRSPGSTFGIISATTGSSMIADVVEASQLKTGRRSEGLFFAASAFVGKSTSGFGILAASTIVAAVTWRRGPIPPSVPPDVMRHFALIYVPTLICLYATSLRAALRLPHHAGQPRRDAAAAGGGGRGGRPGRAGGLAGAQLPPQLDSRHTQFA